MLVDWTAGRVNAQEYSSFTLSLHFLLLHLQCWAINISLSFIS